MISVSSKLEWHTVKLHNSNKSRSQLQISSSIITVTGAVVNQGTKKEQLKKPSKWWPNGETYKKITARNIKSKGFKKSQMSWTYQRKCLTTISKSFEQQNFSDLTSTAIFPAKWVFYANSLTNKRKIMKIKIKILKSPEIYNLGTGSKKMEAILWIWEAQWAVPLELRIKI